MVKQRLWKRSAVAASRRVTGPQRSAAIESRSAAPGSPDRRYCRRTPRPRPNSHRRRRAGRLPVAAGRRGARGYHHAERADRSVPLGRWWRRRRAPAYPLCGAVHERGTELARANGAKREHIAPGSRQCLNRRAAALQPVPLHRTHRIAPTQIQIGFDLRSWSERRPRRRTAGRTTPVRSCIYAAISARIPSHNRCIARSKSLAD